MAPRRRARVRVLVFAVLGLFFLALLVAGLITTVHHAFRSHLNSDLLYIANFYKDLRGGIATWNMPPAPYFFPDMLLIFPLWSISGELGLGYHLYGAVLFLLFLGGFCRLLRPVEPSLRVRCIATLLAALVFLAAFRESSPALGVAFLPIFHAGALVVGLWFLGASWTLLCQPASPVALAAVFLLAALTAASDLIFVIQFIIPISCTLLLLASQGRVSPLAVRAWFYTMWAAGVATVVGLFAFQRMTAVRFHSNFVLENVSRLGSARGILGFLLVSALAAAAIRWPRRAAQAGLLVSLVLLGAAAWYRSTAAGFVAAQPLPAGWPRANLMNFARDMLVLAHQSPVLWGCIPIAAAGTAFCARRAWRQGSRGAPAVFITFSLLGSAAISAIGLMLFWKRIGAIVFSAMTEQPIYQVGGIRHMQPVWVLPIFVIAWALVAERQALPRWILRLAIGAALGFGLIRLSPAVRELSNVSTALPYPNYVRCLDQAVAAYGLRGGYGDYWLARHLSMLSRHPLQVSQVTSDLTPQFWVNASASYLGQGGHSYPRYDFMVAADGQSAQITARLGPPAAKWACPGFTVLIYNRPTDLAFRNFLRIPALAANGRPPPSTLAESALHNIWRPAGTLVPPDSALSSGPVTLALQPLAQGNVLELAVDPAVALSIEFESENRERALLRAEPLADRGAQVLYIPVPPQLSGSAIRHIRVWASDGRSDFRLGHLFLYDDAWP